MGRALVYSLSILSFFLITSCSIIFGIHKVKPKSDKQILRSAKRLGIPETDLYVLDKTFGNYIFNLDSSKFKVQTKNHYQPLQALYFDESGELIKLYINCYAGSLPSLNWNRNGSLTYFPPKDQAPVDTVLNLKKQIAYMNAIDLSNKNSLLEDKSTYKVFVYWNIWMFKHSKKLVREIKKNCSLIKEGKTVKIIYVNNDNWFAWLDKM